MLSHHLAIAEHRRRLITFTAYRSSGLSSKSAETCPNEDRRTGGPILKRLASELDSIDGLYGLGMDQNANEYSRPSLVGAAPLGVIDYVRDSVGSHFFREQPAADGFTPSVASIITTEDDRQVFVKAGPTTDAGGEAVRTGAELAQVVTDLGPALLSWAERDGWYVAIYERLAGAAIVEWQREDIAGLATLSATMRERFDPSPLNGTEEYADAFAPLLGAWSALKDPDGPAGHSVEHVRNQEVPYGLRVETLAGLEEDWFVALRGATSLQHGDLRRDNVMREPSGRLRFVDWTHRWTAPNWADWVRLVPDISADGFDPEQLFQSLTGPETPEHEVNVMLAGLAGRCWRDGYLGAVPGLPQLRPMQRLQGDMALRWLAQRGVH